MTEQTRQLTAILFADMAGYTAIMQEDEELALLLRNKFQTKLEETVKEHQGVLLDFRGDGALCTFNSTLAAVLAAISLQQDMLADPRVPLRMGLHTGDIIVEGKNIYGDGVNIASRLESVGGPGSILISAKVYDDIKNQRSIQAVSLGRYTFKNVKDPIEIYAISNPGLNIPQNADPEGKGNKTLPGNILVLPFVNMSNDHEQDYFSDGLTEELIANLSRLKGIRVNSRTTSMKYKGTTQDIKTIGQETGAGYVIEGSVRKQGNNIRITAQFVDAAQDLHLWADSYTGTLDDIFSIQEKVSLKIAGALRSQLTHEDRETLQKRYTENTEAYQLYLRGRYFWKKRNSEGLHTAIKYFEKAIETDPDYALAWAGIADSYTLLGEYTNHPRREVHAKITSAVNKALAIDNTIAEAHISLATALMLNDWDWKHAEKEFKLGIKLDPNYATGHHWYAEWLLFTGNTAEAFREISLAVELDPVSQGILKDKGIFYYYTRHYDEAIEMATLALELDPGFSPAHRLLSLSFTAKGLFEEAIKENEKWGKQTGDKVKTDISLAYILATSGQREKARKIIEKENMETLLGSNDYRNVALAYAAVGDVEKAFDWLEKSYSLHEESLCSLKVDHKFDILHKDPRFNSLIKRLNFPE